MGSKRCCRRFEIRRWFLLTGCGLIIGVMCAVPFFIIDGHQVDGHAQLGGEERRQRQRAFARQRAVERDHDSPDWLGGYGMVAAA